MSRGRAFPLVTVTCRECGRDFECVEGLPAYNERLCALCDRPGWSAS